MSEYIDRDKLIEMLNSKIEGLKLFGSLYTSQTMRAFEHLAEQINEMPAADVVEVVRCKDCIYASMTIGKEQVKYCDMFDSDDGVYFDKNHFCSYGKRKDGDG